MKYCPLCAGEYRQEIELCASCGAALVASLDAEQVRSNPAHLLWIGSNPPEFDLVAGALQDAHIPALVEANAARMLGRVLKSESQICVLQSDFDRALQVAAQVIAGRTHGRRDMQTCHACNADCPASLTACPACKAIHIVERRTASKTFASGGAAIESAMKYCPVCDARFSAKLLRCSVCSVELVPEELRGRPLNEKERNDRIEVVWRGGDPIAVSEVIAVLREAGIRHHVQATNDHLVFELGMPRPKYAVRVFASDKEKAAELLEGICESAAFGLDANSDSTDETQPIPQRKSIEWKLAASTSEVWSGEDAARANLLEACFYENEIGVRREGKQPGIVRLLVMPADECSAREIVREVAEGTPPE